MKILLLPLLFLCTSYFSFSDIKNKRHYQKEKNVLIFTKNGKGYIHDNIPASIAALQKLGAENGFNTDTTTNAELFNEANLKKYDAIIFSNTNNDVFDSEEQKVAFMRYIQSGGGFIGIHSASGTERKWKWFKQMLGATFLRHPPFQQFSVHIFDKTHPAVKNLPPSWNTNDECYYFKEINPSIRVLAVSDISNLKDSSNGKDMRPDIFGNMYPSIWCHEFDGGRIWYSALGHSIDNYSNHVYLNHLLTGIKWVIDKPKPDYKKAKAENSIIEDFK